MGLGQRAKEGKHHNHHGWKEQRQLQHHDVAHLKRLASEHDDLFASHTRSFNREPRLGPAVKDFEPRRVSNWFYHNQTWIVVLLDINSCFLLPAPVVGIKHRVCHGLVIFRILGRLRTLLILSTGSKRGVVFFGLCSIPQNSTPPANCKTCQNNKYPWTDSRFQIVVWGPPPERKWACIARLTRMSLSSKIPRHWSHKPWRKAVRVVQRSRNWSEGQLPMSRSPLHTRNASRICSPS